MRALVLAGGFPQRALITELRRRGAWVALADYLPNPVARCDADVFHRVSTLDVEAIKCLAEVESVDFLITVCTDQALLTVARVSNELGLPCYLDLQTANDVTNKLRMKRRMVACGVPTSNFEVVGLGYDSSACQLEYPLVVKPADCNSSKGVVRVDGPSELASAVEGAKRLSRTGSVIVEEFVAGVEVSVDAYVESGIAHVLDVTESVKVPRHNGFVICRTLHPSGVGEGTKAEISRVVQTIATGFNLTDSPLLVQAIVGERGVSVIEFSARTGGGVKHLSILRRTGFDPVSAVVDLTLGCRPKCRPCVPAHPYELDEYIYCNPGKFERLEGFDEAKRSGILLDYYEFKSPGSEVGLVSSSGDRVAGFTVCGDTVEELLGKHVAANASLSIVAQGGADVMRHDLLSSVAWGTHAN